MVTAGPVSCIDRYEWPNRKGAMPKLAASAVTAFRGGDVHSAEALCGGVGKRLCDRAEWRTACLGADGARYPWGDERPVSRDKGGVCHTGARWLQADWDAISQRRQLELARLNQSEPAGARAMCASASGAYDMVGNAEEWVRCNGPTGFCLMGGYWAEPRACTSKGVLIHDGRWHGYQTGFRCCSDKPAVTRLSGVMLAHLHTEAPWTKGSGPKARKRCGAAHTLARYNVELGQAGVLGGGPLLSSEADPYLLAAMQWRESNFDPTVAGGGGAWIGAMQLDQRTPLWLWRHDARWKGVKTRDLWDPRTNVDGGYTVLGVMRKLCVDDPLIWVTSYRYSHCRKRSDAEGRIRWALALAFMERAGIRTPVGKYSAVAAASTDS